MNTFNSYAANSSNYQSKATILGKVMSIVAAAILLCAACVYLGKNISLQTAQICSLAGLAVLFISNFISAARRGIIGITVLGVVAALIGFGLGPVIAYYLKTNPSPVYQAVSLTGLITVAMAAAGFAFSKDTIGLMKPLSLIVLVGVVISLLGLVFSSLWVLNPVISFIIMFASAALIFVDFNYVAKHADDDDVVWLATGIFVSIINIFISLLNLFGRD